MPAITGTRPRAAANVTHQSQSRRTSDGSGALVVSDDAARRKRDRGAVRCGAVGTRVAAGAQGVLMGSGSISAAMAAAGADGAAAEAATMIEEAAVANIKAAAG